MPSRSPSLSVPLPFFLAAPLGLAAGGLLLARADGDILVAINAPRTLAVTHTVVLGWLTTSIMGAIYQLGPAVFGGRLVSERLAHIQLITHVVALTTFVVALYSWNLALMGTAGVGLVLSFALFLWNAVPAVWGGSSAGLPRVYLRYSMIFLAGTILLGLTWLMALQHLWFPITAGRLSAHAHIGMVGWLSLTLMGASYQLIPMFSVIRTGRNRLGRLALALTIIGLLVFALLIFTDPREGVRIVAALGLSAGPCLWAWSILGMLRRRSRRRLDIQGRATMVSLGFLALTIVLGLGTASGTPFTSGDQPARWPLAYAVAGLGGWLGCTLIGNSYKIVPFLVWFHRYAGLVGRLPVPLMTEMYSEKAATLVLAGHAAATLCVVAGALFGMMDLIRLGALALFVVATVHATTLALTLVARPASATIAATPTNPGGTP